MVWMQNFERSQEDFESKGFRISHTKTEYMDYRFSGNVQWAATTVKI